MFGLRSNAFLSDPIEKKVQRIRGDNECGLGPRPVHGTWNANAIRDRDDTRSMRRFVVSSDSLYPLTIAFLLKVELKRPINRLVVAG
jgi:hypothetical protein